MTMRCCQRHPGLRILACSGQVLHGPSSFVIPAENSDPESLRSEDEDEHEGRGRFSPVTRKPSGIFSSNAPLPSSFVILISSFFPVYA